MWPGKELAAEAGAEEAGDHADVFNRQPEHLGHYHAVVHDALRGFVERDAVAIPDGDGGVQFDGIMRLVGSDVGGVDLDWSFQEGRVGVAALGDGFALVFEVVQRDAKIGCGGFVVNLNGCRGEGSLLECLGDNDGDVLAPVADGFVFEGSADFAVHRARVAGNGAIELADVAVMQDEDDSRHGFGCCCVDFDDAAAGDGALHGDRVGQVGKVVVGGVLRGAGGLERPVDARHSGADDGRAGDYIAHLVDCIESSCHGLSPCGQTRLTRLPSSERGLRRGGRVLP
jgi:hypothetical protein